MIKSIEKTENTFQTKPKRKFVRLGFNAEEARKLVATLNLLLANHHVHYQKLRNFHWNIRGGDFFELHEVFENLYKEVYNEIDTIAERIRIFDYRPLSTYQEYLNHSKIKENDSLPDSREMAREIVEDFEILLSFMVDVIDVSVEVGDSAT